MSLEQYELIPAEPPPKALRLSGLNWIRKNLFASVFNGTLTVLLTVGLLVGILAVLRFVFSPDRRWEVIPPNAANYTVGSYPRDGLANIWWSVWIIAALAGISTALWGAKGRIPLVKVVAGVRAAGVTALVVGVLSLWSPAGTAVQSLLVWGGAVLVAAGWALTRMLSDDRTVPTTSALAGLVALGLAVTWFLRLGQRRPLAPAVDRHLLGAISVPWARAAGRTVGFATGSEKKCHAPVGGLVSVIYLQIQRSPSLEWEEVLPWLPWAVLVAAVGPVVIGLVSRLQREQAAAVNFLLGGVAIFSWVVQWPMAIRVLTLLLTLFSMATPTFASSPQARKAFYWSWLGGSLCALYFFLLGVGSTDLGIRGDFLGGFNLTILLAVGAIALSFPVGLLLALGRTSTMPIFRLLSVAYIEVVRGVPLITVLFFADKVIPRFLPPWVDVTGEMKALLAITAFSAAYLAENVRGGCSRSPKDNSRRPGHWE